MLKKLSMCAMLLAIGSGSLNAQQQMTTQQHQPQESVTKIEVPGADFDLVVVTTKSQVGGTMETRAQIDPLDAGLWPTRVYLVPKSETLARP